MQSQPRFQPTSPATHSLTPPTSHTCPSRLHYSLQRQEPTAYLTTTLPGLRSRAISRDTQDSTRTILTMAHNLQTTRDNTHDATILSKNFMSLTLPQCYQHSHFTILTTDLIINGPRHHQETWCFPVRRVTSDLLQRIEVTWTVRQLISMLLVSLLPACAFLFNDDPF
jgi:hypothetical protein